MSPMIQFRVRTEIFVRAFRQEDGKQKNDKKFGSFFFFRSEKDNLIKKPGSGKEDAKQAKRNKGKRSYRWRRKIQGCCCCEERCDFVDVVVAVVVATADIKLDPSILIFEGSKWMEVGFKSISEEFSKKVKKFSRTNVPWTVEGGLTRAGISTRWDFVYDSSERVSDQLSHP